MKKILIIIGTILLIALFVYYTTHPLSASVRVKGKTYLVDVAITASDKEKGLSDRTSMPQDHGMLFIFDHKDKHIFSMRNMTFPLDFLWLDGNQIMDITKNVPVQTDGVVPVVMPKVDIDKVIELNAGEADRQGIVVGDTVLFNK